MDKRRNDANAKSAAAKNSRSERTSSAGRLLKPAGPSVFQMGFPLVKAEKRQRSSRPPVTAHRDQSANGRPSSATGRFIQSLHGLVDNLFERRSASQKRALTFTLLRNAVRRNQVILCQQIMNRLDDSQFNINEQNDYGWNIVDEAVMLGHSEIATELFKRGARETFGVADRRKRSDALEIALCGLKSGENALRERLQVEQSENDAVTGEAVNAISKMLENNGKARPPRNHIDNISIEACGESSAAISFKIRVQRQFSWVISHFKVEWSRKAGFDGTLESQIYSNLVDVERLVVENLLMTVDYHFRLSIGNFAGFGPPHYASPTPFVLTSWRSVENLPLRYDDTSSRTLQNVAHQINALLKEFTQKLGLDAKCSDVPSNGRPARSSRPLQRRGSLKDSLKVFLQQPTQAPPPLKGGVFLTCLIMTKSSILLTQNHSLPSALVHSSFSGVISSKDFLWIHKLSAAWNVVCSLMKFPTGSTTDFRLGVLHAASKLQNTLAVENLGDPYFLPIYGEPSTVSILLLKIVDSAEEYRPSGHRWLPMKEAEYLAAESLSSPVLQKVCERGISEFLSWMRAARAPLPRGLYISYTELHVTLDRVAVHADKKHPSAFPSVRIRDNAHVTREEWESVQREGLGNSSLPCLNNLPFSWKTEGASIFNEVVELCPGTSMIILYSRRPPSLVGDTHSEEWHVGIPSTLIPVQVFECEFWTVYRPKAWNPYCRSSLILDMMTTFLQKHSRRRIDVPDLENLDTLLCNSRQLRENLEKLWDETRWLPKLLGDMNRSNAQKCFPCAFTEQKGKEEVGMVCGSASQKTPVENR